MAALTIVLGGCGAVEQAPAGERANLGCVERLARHDASLAAIVTVVPVRGPAAGASRYVSVRFDGGETLAVSEWKNSAAVSAAAQKYAAVRPRLSLGSSETTPVVLEAWTPNADIREFKSCGIGKVVP